VSSPIRLATRWSSSGRLRDTLTVDVYLNVFDDGPTLNSLWSYNLSIEYEPWRVTASNYLPAADICSGSPPNEVCEEGSAWFKRNGSTIVLLKSASPSTPPEQDPTNTNTIHYEDGVEIGLVGSTDGQGDGPGCTDPNEQAANDRVKIASVDFTVLRGFDTSEVESLLRTRDTILSTCLDEVPAEEIDLRQATIVPEPGLAAIQLAALACLVVLRRGRGTHCSR